MLHRKVGLDQISALLLTSCVAQGMLLSQVSVLMSVRGGLYHHPPGMLGRFSGKPVAILHFLPFLEGNAFHFMTILYMVMSTFLLSFPVSSSGARPLGFFYPPSPNYPSMDQLVRRLEDSTTGIPQMMMFL